MANDFVTDFNGLLREIYAGATQSRIDQLLRALNRATHQSRASWIHQCANPALPEAAKVDLTLECTKKLFRAAFQSRSAVLAQGLVEVGRLALLSHCAFHHSTVEACINASDDQSRDVAALEILSAQDYSVLTWPAEMPSLSQQRSRRCRQSAILCLICWLAIARRLKSEEVCAYLDKYIWKMQTNVPRSDQARTTSLISASPSSFKVTSVVSTLSGEQNAILRRALTDQSHRLRTMEADGRRSAKALEDSQRNLTAEKSSRTEVERDLANEKANHAATRVHLQDDYERLRSRLSRNLESASLLLNDGLQALDRDPPKLDIVDHHMRLVQDAIRAEIEWLKREVDDERDRV